MAYTVTTHAPAGGPLRRWFVDLIADITVWRENIETRNALSRLTDAELNDIGLVRGDIDEMSDAELRNR